MTVVKTIVMTIVMPFVLVLCENNKNYTKKSSNIFALRTMETGMQMHANVFIMLMR